MPFELSEAAAILATRTETLKLGGGNTLEVTIGAQSEENPEWGPARLEAYKLIQGKDDAPEAEQREALEEHAIELTARAIFLGWPDGAITLDGKKIKPTLDNRRKILKRFPEIRAQVAKFASASAFVIDAKAEAKAAKN